MCCGVSKKDIPIAFLEFQVLFFFPSSFLLNIYTYRYNPRIRVGNWNSDIDYEEMKLRSFLEKKEKGLLVSQKIQARRQCHLQPVCTMMMLPKALRFSDRWSAEREGADCCFRDR